MDQLEALAREIARPAGGSAKFKPDTSNTWGTLTVTTSDDLW